MFFNLFSWKKYAKNKKGFTLLEVVIALSLFTFISISIMRMTDRSVEYKKKITRNIKDTKYSRTAFQIIRRDIHNMFYRKDMNALIYNEVLSPQENNNQTASKGGSQPEQKVTSHLNEWMRSAVLPYQPVAHPSAETEATGIIGKKDRLHITSRSYIRHYANEKSSDQNIVIYYLKPCKSRGKSPSKETTNTCLWRQFSTDVYKSIENIPEAHDKEFVLLEKVKTFELSYYDFPSNDWLTEWRTGPNRENTLPYAIHIKIEFENRKKQTVKQELNIALHQQFLLPIQ